MSDENAGSVSNHLGEKNAQEVHAPPQEKVYRFLIMAAATAIILVVLRFASVIVAPMLMALFLTIVLIVPLRWLQKKGCPNILAMAIILGCTGIVFLGIGQLVATSLNDFIKHFPDYSDKIADKVELLDEKLATYGFVIGKFEKKSENETSPENGKSQVSPPTDQTPVDEPKKPVALPSPEKTDEPNVILEKKENEPVPDSPVPEEPPSRLPDVDDHVEVSPLEPHTSILPEARTFEKTLQTPPSLIELNTETVMYWVGKFVFELRHLAETGFLVMIITLFMISEAARFPEKIDWALGASAPINNKHLHNIAEEIRRYLFIKSVACVMSSSAATIVYLIFDVPGALLWGLIAFFLYFIPNLGGIIAAIIPGLLIFMSQDIEGVLLYGVCLVAIECTIGYGIEPKMLGHGLGISTVVIFLSLLSWGWILGPVGLFLAAPLTIMVKIVLQAFKETEWIAILLGDKNHPDLPKSS